MNRNAVTEADIIDMLLGQATPDHERQIAQAMQSNPGLLSTHKELAPIIPALRFENRRLEATTERVWCRLEPRLEEERHQRRVETESATWKLVWGGWSRARKAVAAFALLACLMTPLLGWLLHGEAPHPVGNIPSAHVAFLSDQTSEMGTPSHPFKTLDSGIAAVRPGGTVWIEGNTVNNTSSETIRISKRVRIEAVNGSVRVGGL